jgi:hypothetical protein
LIFQKRHPNYFRGHHSQASHLRERPPQKLLPFHLQLAICAKCKGLTVRNFRTSHPATRVTPATLLPCYPATLLPCYPDIAYVRFWDKADIGPTILNVRL